MSDSPHCPHQGVCAAQPAQFETVASFSGLAPLRALSLSHRAVGLTTLSRHAMSAEAGVALHGRLTQAGIESLVLTTCNRTELYWRARLPGDDEMVTCAFEDATGTREHGVLVCGPAAARHLFRVCAGLALQRVIDFLDAVGHGAMYRRYPAARSSQAGQTPQP